MEIFEKDLELGIEEYEKMNDEPSEGEEDEEEKE